MQRCALRLSLNRTSRAASIGMQIQLDVLTIEAKAGANLDPASGHFPIADNPRNELGRVGHGHGGDVGLARDGVEQALERNKVRLDESLCCGILPRVRAQFAGAASGVRACRGYEDEFYSQFPVDLLVWNVLSKNDRSVLERSDHKLVEHWQEVIR